MESLSSSVSTVPSFEDYFAHNMWNPLLDLLFLEQTSSAFVLEVEESLSLSVSTVPSFADDFAHNMDSPSGFALSRADKQRICSARRGS